MLVCSFLIKFGRTWEPVSALRYAYVRRTKAGSLLQNEYDDFGTFRCHDTGRLVRSLVGRRHLTDLNFAASQLGHHFHNALDSLVVAVWTITIPSLIHIYVMVDA